MTYTFRTSKAEKLTSKSLNLAPGVNSFCVDRFGHYDLLFSGCHTYDTSTPKSFKTGEEKPVAVNAVKHRNGVRILSNIKSSFKVLVELEDSGKNEIVFTEEPTKVNGMTAYRYDFDLKPSAQLTVTPQSDTVLFNPVSKQIFGANDCVEVSHACTSRNI